LVPAAGSFAAPGLKPPPPKASPLVGDWEPVRDGPPPPGAPARLTITFTPDGKLRYDQGRPDPEWGWYRADATKDPPQIDHATPAVAAHPDERKPYLGIYRLDGDVLTICCAEGERPSAFAAPAGSKVMVIRYRRVKKD
jgi:uncharacterized protein (TIGR03067 family)